MKSILIFTLCSMLLACSQPESKKALAQSKESEYESILAEETNELKLMKGFEYQALFSEGDEVETRENYTSPAKGLLDLIVYLPKDGSSKEGDLLVSHETGELNRVLGHGGGASIMKIEKKKGEWELAGKKHNIDFSDVGYTLRNCGGKITPYGTVMLAEEALPATTVEMINQLFDASEKPVDTLHENFGWMVEVNPESRKAIRKLTAMGRFVHEDAITLPDNKTVILTNDDSPAVLFKFVAESEYDFSKGKLFAYSETGNHWIELPGDLESLKNIKQVAIEKGATLFVRHEWVTQVGEILYISETGHDLMQWDEAVKQGGKPASYFEKKKMEQNTYSDPYGRVISLNTRTWELDVVVEGGVFGQNECFSNPDCINHFSKDGNDYLIISEDVIGLSHGRVSQEAALKGEMYCEVYLLNLKKGKQEAKDLIRFATAPKGSETTGLYFTPDEKTLFMAIQHPDASNPKPFNKSTAIAITGF